MRAREKPRRQYPTRHQEIEIQAIFEYELVKIKSSEQQVLAPKITTENLELLMNVIVYPKTGNLLEYRHIISNEQTHKTWEQRAANEFRIFMKRLPKRGIFGTETMEILFAREVPHNLKVTYVRLCCNYREQKEENANAASRLLETEYVTL